MENNSTVDWRRIQIYLALAFGIAWFTGLVIFLRGGLENSRELIPDSGLTEAFVLMATAYFFAPAIAHALTRILTREGWQDTWLKLDVRKSFPFLAATWFVTPLLLAFGAVLYFLFFPDKFDSSLTYISDLISQYAGENEIPFGPGGFAAIQILQGILIAPVLNLVPIFGEEFGWRAYLLPRLLPLGEHRAYLISGVVWGVWHAPIIAMGYNYGLNYPGAPWTGVLLFIWVSFVLGTFFGWATIRAKNIWPAIVGHAVLNGTASAVLLFTRPDSSPTPLLGPLVAGVIGSIGFTLVAGWIFLRASKHSQPDETVQME